MKHCSTSPSHSLMSSLAVGLLCAAVATLTGCSASFSFPNAELNPQAVQAVSAGTIKGSNFGGHAPIVGAKLFMLQASTSGYGTKATSLINASGGTADTMIVGSAGTPAYYVTTDAAGGFTIPSTGYACTPGLPVYLYAYGGAPDTNPAVGPSYITSATGNGTTTTFTVGNEKFYVGQQVTFQGIPTGNPFVNLDGGVVGGNGTDIAGTPQTVTAISTTDNTTFSIASSFNGTTAPGAFGNNSTVSPIGVNNPGIVNLAVLGLCPNDTVISAIPAASGSTVFTGVSAGDLAKISVGELVQGPGLPSGGFTIATKTGNGFTVNGTETGGNGTTAYNYAVGGGNFETTGGSPLSYVYMNEVSTTAAAFALAPFASSSVTASASATYPADGTSGNVTVVTPQDAQRIGIPAATAATYTANPSTGNTVTLTPATGDALALTAIQNAAVNAGALYDITGASNTVTSTDGESHVARTVVPNNGAGGSQGIVPNALINTLGNILAACVDSNNTYGLGAPGGTPSANCATLFENATASGTASSTYNAAGNPTDIATAAINIAHHPGANVAALYTLAGNVVPFVPNLVSTGAGVPNDFTIGINMFLLSYLGGGILPQAVATDSSGNAIVTTPAPGCTNGCALEFLPTQLLYGGGAAFVTGPSANVAAKVGPGGDTVPAETIGGVAFAPNGSTVWVTNAANTVGTQFNPVGTYLVGNEPFTSSSFTGYLKGNTSYYASPAAVALDGAGNAYIADYGDANIYKLTAAGATATTITNTCNAGGMNAIAIDSAANGYNIWAVNSADNGDAGICETNNAGTTVLVQQGGQGTGNWNSIAIDANGAGWSTTSGQGLIQFPGGSGYNTHLFSQTTTASVGGVSSTSGAHGVAIDGNDEVWVANNLSNSVSNLLNNGVTQQNYPASTAFSAASPSTGYTASGLIKSPVGLALDISGDVWVINQGTVTYNGSSPAPATQAGAGSVTELIGVAAPSYLPLSAAGLNNKIGAKP